MDDTSSTVGTDLGEALSTLGDSMERLSADLTDLNSAVSKLEASTRTLSDQQRAVSEELGDTAASLRAEQSTPTAPVSPSPFGRAARDD